MLMAVGDPGVPDPLRVQREVVVVMCDDDPTGRQGIGNVVAVVRALKADLTRRGDIDPPTRRPAAMAGETCSSR